MRELAGNAMSLCVVEQLLRAALVAVGVDEATLPNRWRDGSAQAALVRDAWGQNPPSQVIDSVPDFVGHWFGCPRGRDSNESCLGNTVPTPLGVSAGHVVIRWERIVVDAICAHRRLGLRLASRRTGWGPFGLERLLPRIGLGESTRLASSRGHPCGLCSQVATGTYTGTFEVENQTTHDKGRSLATETSKILTNGRGPRACSFGTSRPTRRLCARGHRRPRGYRYALARAPRRPRRRLILPWGASSVGTTRCDKC